MPIPHWIRMAGVAVKFSAYNLNCTQKIPFLCCSKTELNFHPSFQIVISVTSGNINDLKIFPANLAAPSTPTSSPVWVWALRASYGIEAWVGWGERWMGHCSSAVVINSCCHLLRCSPSPSYPLLSIYRGLGLSKSSTVCLLLHLSGHVRIMLLFSMQRWALRSPLEATGPTHSTCSSLLPLGVRINEE